MKVAIPTENHRKYEDTVAETFSKAPTFTLISVENGKPTEITVIDNKASEYYQGAGPIASKTLKENGVTTILTGELGPGAKTILQTLEIDFYITETGKKVKDVLDEWLSNRENITYAF
jgi:predicted Fe-Mo cluster-binding NifX family protein